MMPSSPHNITMGTGDGRISESALLRLCGHTSVDPMDVLDQSRATMSRPASPQLPRSVCWNDVPALNYDSPFLFEIRAYATRNNVISQAHLYKRSKPP